MSAPTPHPGDWLVTRTSGRLIDRLAAWAIRWGTARKVNGRWRDAAVNHAAIYIGPTAEYPGGAIVEARPGGAGYASFDAYPGAKWSTGRLPAHLTPNAQQRGFIVAKAISLVGTPYGWLDILAIGLAQRRLGAHVTGREWWVRRIASHRTLICSQYVDVADQAGAIVLVPGRLPGLVTPEDLDELLLPATLTAA